MIMVHNGEPRKKKICSPTNKHSFTGIDSFQHKQNFLLHVFAVKCILKLLVYKKLEMVVVTLFYSC